MEHGVKQVGEQWNPVGRSGVEVPWRSTAAVFGRPSSAEFGIRTAERQRYEEEFERHRQRWC